MSKQQEELEDQFKQSQKEYQKAIETIQDTRQRLSQDFDELAGYGSYLSNSLEGVDYRELIRPINQEAEPAFDQLSNQELKLEEELEEVSKDYRRQSRRLEEEELADKNEKR